MGPTDGRAAGVTVRTSKRGIVRCQVDGTAVQFDAERGRVGFGDCLVKTGIIGVGLSVSCALPAGNITAGIAIRDG